MSEKKHHIDKKKAAAATMATVIGASGVAVDAHFDSPAEILQRDAGIEPQVQYVDSDGSWDGTAPGDEDRQRTAPAPGAGSFKEKILSLPLAVRACFVLPLWALGHLILMGGGALVTALSPFLSGLFNFLLLSLVIFLALAFGIKLMFPDIPLGKLLNRHTLKGALLGAAILFATDFFLPLLWPEYTRWKLLVLGLLGLAILFLLALHFGRREEKRRAEEQAKTPTTETEEILEVSSMGQSFTMRVPKR